MGRESASYFLQLPRELDDAVVLGLREGGAESGDSNHTWIGLRVRDPHRYWIDLRLHRGPESLLEIRIALTNDEWSIRAPLEDALAALPAGAAQRLLRDEDGRELGRPVDDGWSLRIEEDYGRRRAAFVARVGDYTAPISADHVYLFVHQTRWNHDNDAELSGSTSARSTRSSRCGTRRTVTGRSRAAGRAVSRSLAVMRADGLTVRELMAELAPDPAD